LLQVADGLAQGLGAGQLAEQVAGDEQDVDLLGGAVAGDALDGPAQVVGAVDPAEAVGQVPVGGVQDAHAVPRVRQHFHALSHKGALASKPSSEGGGTPARGASSGGQATAGARTASATRDAAAARLAAPLPRPGRAPGEPFRLARLRTTTPGP